MRSIGRGEKGGGGGGGAAGGRRRTRGGCAGRWPRPERSPRGDVLEDPAEVAEPDRRVDALGHRGRLDARRPAAAVTRVVELEGGERGAQPAAARALDRCDVVDPAVAVAIEGERGGDARAVGA